MKYSRQRELILEAVCGNAVHPTADDVYSHLRPENPSLSLGTVYRNLNQLAQCGMIRKIPMPSGSDRFDGRLDEHYHIVCERCGGVFDVEFGGLDQLDARVARETGFIVTGHELLVNGVCRVCQDSLNTTL